jgi:alpha-galactosidase
MSSKRIVLIGAGSMVFGEGLMKDVVLSPHLAGSTVALVDLNETKLELMARVAQRMIDQQESDIRLETTTERRDVLADADYVITTISVGGQTAWEKDLNIPLEYGIVQSVGDSVGPGGISRAFRHIPVVLEIAHDMMDLCPDAVLFNYSNPMSAICRAVERESSIQVVGLCHGVTNTRSYLSEYIDVPAEQLEVRAAGINHLVWMVQLLHNGRDAYPKLRAALARKGPGERPASFELMQLYGLFPGPGHDHVVMFFPFFLSADAGLGERYDVGLFPLASMNREREQLMERFKAQAEGRVPISVQPSGEDVMDIITARVTHQPKICAVNVPNHGAVGGLQDHAIVEVSALVDGGGIQPLRVDSLPAAIRSILRARIDQQEMVVGAAIGGDRSLALQALLADPLVGSVASARAILDKLLQAHAAHMPTFS